MEYAHTGTEPKCKNANTGTGTIEYQFGWWTMPILALNQNEKVPIPVWAQLNAITSNGLRPYWYWTKVQKYQYRYGHHWLSVPVMESAHTGTEPECKNASNGMGTIEC